jgi:hypothetical protein
MHSGATSGGSPEVFARSWGYPDAGGPDNVVVTRSSNGQRREQRSLTVEDRFECGRQMLELRAAHVIQEMLPQSEHVNVRGLAQERPAFGGEGRERAPSVALEDATLDEAFALEMIDRAGHPAG